MDIIINWARYETLFQGETVSMDLLPLRTSDFRFLSGYMRKTDDMSEAADLGLKMLEGSAPIFERCVRNIQGVTVNGAPPTSEMLAQESVLVFLAKDIAQELFLRSMLKAGEEKNSGPQSGPSTS